MRRNDKRVERHDVNKLHPLHGRLMALMTRAGITDDARHDLVYAWTQGRTNSSRQLTVDELRDLVWKFDNQFNSSGNEPQSTRAGINLVVDAEMKRLRSIILKIATYVGIKERDGFDSFNSFMKHRSVCKKELHKYTLEELHKLRAQFHQLEKNYERSAQQQGTKAWFEKQHLPGVGAN